MSTCRSCGKPIEWARTEKGGKPMPLDVGERSDDGNLVVVDRGRNVVRYVKAGQGNRVSHFATCENADQHRKKS